MRQTFSCFCFSGRQTVAVNKQWLLNVSLVFCTVSFLSSCAAFFHKSLQVRPRVSPPPGLACGSFPKVPGMSRTEASFADYWCEISVSQPTAESETEWKRFISLQDVISSDVNKTFLSRPRPRPRPPYFFKTKTKTFSFKTKTKTKTKTLFFCPRGASRPRLWSRGLHHW